MFQGAGGNDGAFEFGGNFNGNNTYIVDNSGSGDPEWGVELVGIDKDSLEDGNFAFA